MKIIGIKSSSFVSERDGATINGVNLYVTYPMAGEGAQGMACEPLYLTDNRLAQCRYPPRLGDEINISYNRYGKPAAIFPVPPAKS